ncbi:hypothetical protein ACEWY4_017210 [Coilia grayii]|uniref:AIG1-type G domain-containing protein n=1 Tax=Coilia grayii TaxID=363190 RepID=A0ABD1JJ40_9TELE
MADDGSHSPTEGVHHLSDMRIVLLGNREAGKSSAGNTILGREEFDPEVTTLQCVKRQGEVAGRQVTVVDTPGWTGYDLSFGKDSPNLLKQELVLSVTLCPPGPHAFLLVVHENMTFTEAERNATTHHLSLLGHEAWKHSLVLFIQETPVEEKAFEVKGNMLQWLVEKFGSRCHVLNTKNRDDLQVRELLEKIDKMVAGNSGVGYETQRKVVKEYNMASEGTAQVWKRGPLRSLRQGNTFMSELALVLLGCEGAGKSSSGNTILGREEFDLKSRTAQCVKRRGTVAGRQVTVVEAPGWVPYVPSEYSSTKVKKEIVLSESLCARAPHTVCVVVRVDAAFKEQHKKSVRQHLGLLGDRVWSPAMVLFTHGDWLGDTPIEQHIESEGESLRWLIEKCGNRYHVLNNHNCTDETQVTGLLEKIGEMAADNRGSVCERTCLSKKAKQVSEWKKHVEKRAEKRRKEQRRCPRPSVEKHPTLSEFRVVLLGHRGSGKSSSGNTILGREEFDLRRTAQCVKRQGEVAGRQVTVVEAPGWWYDVNLKDTPELTKQEIVLSPSMCAPGPHAFLLLLRVDLSVTERMRNMIQEYIDHLNGNVWNHAILLFTRGDWLGDTTIEQHMDNEGKTLKCLAEMCGNRYHVFSNMHRGDSTQVAQLMEKIEEMVAENRGRHYEMDRERLKEMEKRRKQQMERAKDREMFAYKRKTSLQLSLGKLDESSVMFHTYATPLTLINKASYF